MFMTCNVYLHCGYLEMGFLNLPQGEILTITSAVTLLLTDVSTYLSQLLIHVPTLPRQTLVSEEALKGYNNQMF